ncbi:glycosyltransferase family 2 protein [Aliiroseovarius sp. 2305UL8-7]|uniref:glycosyltransferase family 2 protein n=1 Tax=Aliiroseovarius conchicola TaxID=3121637 RepID=UPI00352969C8
MRVIRRRFRGWVVNLRVTAVTCVKNEGAFLLEWLAHHRAIGFTDFVVLSNDCDDGTDLMLDRLGQMGVLSHIRNEGPYDQGGVQWTGFKIADKHPAVRDADWLMTLDVDEFVNIHTGDHTLAALIAALPDADAVTLTWRLFGNAGIASYADQPVTEQFVHAAPEVMAWPWRAFMFKTLFRNRGAYKKLGVHRPRAPVDGKADQARWFDGHGRELPAHFQRGQIFSPFNRPNYGLAQLNHYPLGAMESFILKCDRGRVNRSEQPIGMDYWCERNWNAIEDRSILNTIDIRNAALHQLTADPQLAELHTSAVQWRKKKFVALMQEEPNRALLGRLMTTPYANPITEDQARFLYRFVQSPQVARD